MLAQIPGWGWESPEVSQWQPCPLRTQLLDYLVDKWLRRDRGLKSKGWEGKVTLRLWAVDDKESKSGISDEILKTDIWRGGLGWVKNSYKQGDEKRLTFTNFTLTDSRKRRLPRNHGGGRRWSKERVLEVLPNDLARLVKTKLQGPLRIWIQYQSYPC